MFSGSFLRLRGNLVVLKGSPSADRLFDRLFLLWKFALLIVANWLGESQLRAYFSYMKIVPRHAMPVGWRWTFKGLQRKAAKSIFVSRPKERVVEVCRNPFFGCCDWDSMNYGGMYYWTTEAIRPCHTAAILSRETKRALFYHAKPRSGNHGGEAWPGKTKLFWSSGTIWPPCDKGEWIDTLDAIELRMRPL